MHDYGGIFLMLCYNQSPACLQKNTKVISTYASLDCFARVSASKELHQLLFSVLSYLMSEGINTLMSNKKNLHNFYYLSEKI